MDEIIVLSTTDSQELAEKIATALVDSGDAACVNIVPGIRSIYRWEGKVCNEPELLLLIKSSAGKFEDIRSKIRKMHTYQVPEVLALRISECDPDYLKWLVTTVGSSGSSTV